jgi:adenosylmethionine-8-amino-7-oxononanoate aminotransferase
LGAPIVTTTAQYTTRQAVAAELEDLDRRHLIHPHSRAELTERRVIVRGEGCTVWDAEGNELLDITGGANWLCQVGHGRRELADVAAKQMTELAYFTSFDIYSNDKSIALAARLAELAPHGMGRVFFTCGGSEGVDTAFKAARLFFTRRGEPDRTWIIARRNGYHGATYGSGTATGFDGMQFGIGPNLPHIEKVSPPWPYRADELYAGEDTTTFLVRELDETIQRIGPDKVAAMIGEPVIGGGGILVPPADYWPKVRELLSRYGILLIADEVVTAFGRTGFWFDSVQRGMAPDMIVTAKGLTSGYAPLGAVLFRDEIADAIMAEDGFFHGHTFFGHPVATAVAQANLNIIEREGLVERAPQIGEWFRAGLAPAQDLPDVGEIRIAGATVGIEMVTDKQTKGWAPAGGVAHALRHNHGVIARDYGSVLVICPSLVLTEQQADRACAAIVNALSAR